MMMMMMMMMMVMMMMMMMMMMTTTTTTPMLIPPHQVFACTAISDGERDICEAVLRIEGFHLAADIVPSRGNRNVLVTASEADSSSSSGFRVARATSKLWNCLAMGGMVVSHTWLFA